MKKKSKWIVLLCVLVIFFIIVLWLALKDDSQNIVVFSWETEMLKDEENELFDILDCAGADTIYQYISSKTDEEDVKQFLKKAYKNNITVYLLAGEPDWALEENVESYEMILRRAEEYNDLVETDAAIQGVVFDVEPYALEEWDDNQEDIMEKYVSAMKKTYEMAKEKGLSMVACIPYYYDNKQLDEELESLIKEACDEVAIMNYYREKEIENIQTEAALALKYNKKLINIYEFQPVGVYGLIDENTYHSAGFRAAEDNFMKLKHHYSNQKIIMGLHEVDSLKEVMDLE